VFARHKLNTCRQKSEEKIEEFFQYLKILSADCNFAAVTAGRNRDAAICNAFVARLWSGCIRQCLLEDNVRELQAAFDKARTLDEAQRNNCEEYCLSADSISVHSVDSAAACNTSEENSVSNECVSLETKCYFCSNKRHPPFKCPVRDHVCYKCKKKGHFSSVCLSESINPAPTAALTSQQSSLYAALPLNSNDDKVNVFALVNGVLTNCLTDTGAKRSHIDEAFINWTKLSVNDSTKEEIGLAVKAAVLKLF